jgi:endonuclease/exonuclease/phosphatase family metal-dependent hydrolase
MLGQSRKNLRLKVLSYNIHRGIGFNRRKKVDRIAAVLRTIQPDIVALQEVENARAAAPDSEQLAYLAAQTGMTPIPGPTLFKKEGDYGNAVLTRLPIREVRRHDISFSGREPRGLIDVELNPPLGSLRILTTHLGLKTDERRYQIDLLKSIILISQVKPVLLMGDMNEWLPRGRVGRFFREHFGHSPSPRTFPALLPIFPLDRILAAPGQALVHVEAVTSFQARIASDHLPVLATIEIPPTAENRESAF